MRLTDLKAHWRCTDENPNPTGVNFLCPAGCGKHIGVGFVNPIGGGPPETGCDWSRSDDTFDTLTLTPSVNEMPRHGFHGFVTNGEITASSYIMPGTCQEN